MVFVETSIWIVQPIFWHGLLERLLGSRLLHIFYSILNLLMWHSLFKYWRTYSLKIFLVQIENINCRERKKIDNRRGASGTNLTSKRIGVIATPNNVTTLSRIDKLFILQGLRSFIHLFQTWKMDTKNRAWLLLAPIFSQSSEKFRSRRMCNNPDVLLLQWWRVV